MKTYDKGASTHGKDSRWLYRWQQRLLAALDREREIVTLRNVVGMMSEARRSDAREYGEMHESLQRARDVYKQRDELLKALNAMLTHMGMDEDEWNKPTFDQARAAIAKATGGTA